MKKVIVRLRGGLGNQMFGYAAARRLAHASGCELVVDHLTGFCRDIEYRRTYELDHFCLSARLASESELLMPCERLRRALHKFRARLSGYHKRAYIEQVGNDYDPRLLDLKVTQTLYLDGLWQSEAYFQDISDVVRAEFAIRGALPPWVRKVVAQMRGCRALSVHVRYYDAPGVVTGSNLDPQYYDRAFHFVEKAIGSCRMFVFSDNCAAAREMLGTRVRNAVFVSDIAPANAPAAWEMWLMSQCRHAVLANSTFSWWGAWLRVPATAGVTVCPQSNERLKAAKTPWGFAGQIPERWTRL